MDKFIARMILQQANIGLENGQNKYRAYFVNTTLYTKWQKGVDAILTTEGYEDCIVTD